MCFKLILCQWLLPIGNQIITEPVESDAEKTGEELDVEDLEIDLPTINSGDEQKVWGDDLHWIYLNPEWNGLVLILEGLGMEILVRAREERGHLIFNMMRRPSNISYGERVNQEMRKLNKVIVDLDL